MEAIRKPISKVFIASRLANVSQLVRDAVKPTSNITVSELPLAPDGRLSPDCLNTIPEIEILFADPPVIGQVMTSETQSLKWVQNTFAGVDAIMKQISKLETIPKLLLTRQTDGFGQIMGEYVIGQIIGRERRFSEIFQLQQQALYNQSPYLSYRSLKELSVGILGLGTIGQEVARQCRCMNMTVWAAVRDERLTSGTASCPHVSHFRPMSRLSEMLKECDYVVNVMPSTPDTRGLLGGDVMQACSNKKSVFINIGRGDVIDDDSLVHAIRSGWLGGAILDVFNEEPLPCDHQLWSLPGVTITPHVSGATDVHKAVKTFTDNLQRFNNGEPLMNLVDISRGY